MSTHDNALFRNADNVSQHLCFALCEVDRSRLLSPTLVLLPSWLPGFEQGTSEYHIEHD